LRRAFLEEVWRSAGDGGEDVLGEVAILPSMKSTVVTSSPDVMGGTPVFAGTRVPIENLLDYLEGGESIEDFLEGFPSVSREQVITFLEETKARVLAEAR
jgi:uncharacterized protein (DUF433 family)